MIIVVAHQKGGTGKSTIATNLAVMMHTELLDLDKQYSGILFNYYRMQALGEEKALPCWTVAEGGCNITGQTPVPESQLEDFFKYYKGKKEEHVMVDCGGYDGRYNRMALFYADFLLTPVSPYGIEIFGLQKFEEILKEIELLEEMKGKHIRTHVLINNADRRQPKRIQEVQQFIQTHNDHFILLDTVVGRRSEFPLCYELGKSVAEKNAKGKSAAELTQLIHEITAKIKMGGTSDAV